VLVAAASVACQAAGRGELAILEDRGHRVASRQQRELLAPADEELVGADHQSCRRGSNSRPDRLLGQTTCRSELLRNASLSMQVESRRDRSVSLSAIGQCLKDQYDAIAPSMPPRLAALVEQLETQK
jgi:hypothetical protein